MPKKKPTAGQEFIDDLFLRMLQGRIKGFVALTFSEQFHLAQLILSAEQKWRRHSRRGERGGFVIPYQEQYRLFGRGRFEEINKKLELFLSSEQWWKSKGEARVYWLAPKARQIRERYLNPSGKKLEGQFIYESGQYLRKPPRAIASKDRAGNSARNQCRTITPLTPINARNLEDYAKALQKEITRLKGGPRTMDLFIPRNPQGLLTKVRERMNYVQLLLRYIKTDIGQNKYLIHRYVETSTGRLYAQGPANLQNGIKEVRQVALQGRYDYDFENCHYSMLLQLAEIAGGKCPAIRRYLDQKQEIREALAEHVREHVNLVKQCLLAMIYGAEKTTYWDAAISRYLGKAGAEKFYKHHFVVALQADLDAGREIIIETHRPSKRGRITNAMGRKVSAAEDHKKIMAHILQGLEAKMLEMAREEFHDQIILLQHDGFTTLERVDYVPLLKRIKDELGMGMEMSEDLLQVPAHLVTDEPNAFQTK